MALVNVGIALKAAAEGDVFLAAIFGLASVLLVVGDRLRRRHLAVPEQQQIDHLHRGIDWVTLVATLLALTACGLVAGTTGVILGEPLSRVNSGIMLAFAASTGGLLWFLLRRVRG